MDQATLNPSNEAAGAGRPSVISLAIREKAALYAAYMPFIQGGGLFVPTSRQANLGDDLYLILTLVDDATKFALPGKVVWVTPAGSTGRQQGIGIQFARNEAGEQVRAKIEELIGGALKSSRPTHTV
jgi:type IV pilus assembly protein PilZ